MWNYVEEGEEGVSGKHFKSLNNVKLQSMPDEAGDKEILKERE